MAFLLAGGLVLHFRNHLPVGFPEVAVAGRLLIAFGDLLPQTLTGRSASIARHESHDPASLSTQGEPDSHLLALTVDKGPQLIQFEYLLAWRLEEGLLQLEGDYLFLS
ncbi:MAG: hypothetical protein LC740_15020 [Actinobacteria bacterium]|nr:hypothetical protein [Actinomycetota bacterium]